MRFRPRVAEGPGSSRVRTRRVCALASNPPASPVISSRAASPLCPNGGWPRSWASPAVSSEDGVQAERPADLAGDVRDLQ